MKIDRIVLNLRRNIIAQSAFQEALSACRFLMNQDLEFDPYPAIATGISVTYARPFMSATGLGSLDQKKFGVFPDRPDLEHVHKDIVRGRNSIDAHYSPTEAAGMLSDPEHRREQIRLRLHRERGVWLVQPPLAVWSPQRLHVIEELIGFQLERLQEEAGKLITLLEGEKNWPDGLYHLGENFP